MRYIIITIIIIVTACSLLGQAVTLNQVNSDAYLQYTSTLSFDRTPDIITLNSLQGVLDGANVVKFHLSSPSSLQKHYVKNQHNDDSAIFNHPYVFGDYYIDTYYYTQGARTNSFLLDIQNSVSADNTCILLDFKKEPSSSEMLGWEWIGLRNHVTIIDSSVYLAAFDNIYLYVVEYSLSRKEITSNIKVPFNPNYEGNYSSFILNMGSLDDRKLVISFIDQIFIIDVSDFTISKMTLDSKFTIQKSFIDGDNLIMFCTGHNFYRDSDFNFISVSLIDKSVNWAYKLKVPYKWNIVQRVNIGTLNSDNYIFTVYNPLGRHFYTPVIKLDPNSYKKSKIYGFHGELHDFRKITDNHFKITGTLNKREEDLEEVIFHGDLFFDGRGDCMLDTTCMQLDTLDNVSTTTINNIAFKAASIKSELINIEKETDMSSANPLLCWEYQYDFNGEFTFLADTICYSDFLSNIRYERGYYDSSHWKIYLNDTLIYSKSIEFTDFNTSILTEGNILMTHYLIVGGCEYLHEDSAYIKGISPIISDKTILCLGENALLELKDYDLHKPVSISWVDEENNLISTRDSLRVCSPGTYYARIDDGYCEWQDTITIYEAENCINYVSSDINNLCPGESALLQLKDYRLNEPVSISWKDVENRILSTEDSLRVCSPGIYFAEIDNGYCEWQDTIIIMQGENCFKYLSSDVESICPDESALLSVDISLLNRQTSINWYTNSGEHIGKVDSIRISLPGTYEVHIDNGICQWVESIRIDNRKDGCEFSIYIPSAFTPNEDWHNDYWQVFSRYSLDVSIEVYDRWGERVYHCIGKECAWDGTYEGEDMPVGVYVYKVEAIIPETGEHFKESGTLELLR